MPSDKSGGRQEVGVAEMDPAGWGKMQRPVSRNRANVVSDLVDDDLVVIAWSPKPVHEDLTLTMLML
jgi:hypothetical protein